MEAGRVAYRRVVWDLTQAGLDRKAARGAARGFLSSSLYTEMIFSASVAQWKRIFAQRISVHADAEIREIMTAAKEIVDDD
jgi:thymidylate synthase ThyX